MCRIWCVIHTVWRQENITNRLAVINNPLTTLDTKLIFLLGSRVCFRVCDDSELIFDQIADQDRLLWQFSRSFRSRVQELPSISLFKTGVNHLWVSRWISFFFLRCCPTRACWWLFYVPCCWNHKERFARALWLIFFWCRVSSSSYHLGVNIHRLSPCRGTLWIVVLGLLRNIFW